MNNYFEVGALYECEGVSYTLNENEDAWFDLVDDLIEEGYSPFTAKEFADKNLLYYIWNNDIKEVTFEGTKEEIEREMKFLGFRKVF
ncbi:hypothetical protein [Clostridium phage vB_CpeP_PMQ04]|nr:hypothetical protein [Clostridium phage vB_CpeP_PMQ04]